jgi:hypothetical protein
MHVSLTLSTVPLLLLVAYLWKRAQKELLPVVMFTAIFQAASIVNIGIGGAELGIGPSMFVLLMAVGQQLLNKKPSALRADQRPLRSSTLLLFAFTAYATITALINPFLFRGVLVNNAKFGLNAQPLEFRPGCISQVIYLLLFVLLYFTSGYRTSGRTMEKALNWYVGGAVLAAFISIYQFLCLKTGLPFPKEIFHSNPGYAIFEGYDMGGFARMNSTFTEASAAAEAFVAALALVLWRIVSGTVSIRNLLISVVLFIGLFLTVSTSGYLCIAVVATICAVGYFRRTPGSPESRAAKVLLAIPVMLAVVALIVTPSAQEAASDLVHMVILDKKSSSSYKDRTQANDDALSTAAETHWIGAGYGVCRGSSLIPTTLGNTGIPGFLLLALFLLTLYLPLFKKGGVRSTQHGAILLALTSVMVDLLLAGPEMTAPVVWVLFAEASRMAAAKPPRRIFLRRIEISDDVPELEPGSALIPLYPHPYSVRR